jgi:hypothetical protein
MQLGTVLLAVTQSQYRRTSLRSVQPSAAVIGHASVLHQFSLRTCCASKFKSSIAQLENLQWHTDSIRQRWSMLSDAILRSQWSGVSSTRFLQPSSAGRSWRVGGNPRIDPPSIPETSDLRQSIALSLNLPRLGTPAMLKPTALKSSRATAASTAQSDSWPARRSAECQGLPSILGFGPASATDAKLANSAVATCPRGAWRGRMPSRRTS